MWKFFDVDQGGSSCKLSREYFLLWVIITRHSLETFQRFRSVQTKQRMTDYYTTNTT